MLTGTSGGISLPQLAGPSHETALIGFNMPFANLALHGANDFSVAISISAGVGTLYSDTAPGAAVSGGGTSSLWITGSISQINAKLATLVYVTASMNADTLSIHLLGPNGSIATLGVVPIDVLPLIASTPDPISIEGGTLTLDFRTLDGVTIDVSQRGADSPPTALILVNSTIGMTTTLDIGTASQPSSIGPRIALAGRVEFAGQVKFQGGPASMSLALGTVLTNDGMISFRDSVAVLSTGGTLRNNGAMTVSGGHPVVNTPISGGGSITLAPDTSLTLAGAVTSDQTIRLSGRDTLVLGAPATMTATVDGLAASDVVVLTGVAADATFYQAIDADHGVLTVYDGPNVVATLHLADVAAGSFVLSPSTIAGSVQIGLLATSLQTAASVSSHNVNVYRFFDTAHGTEFLTQDEGERNAIVAGRPDMAYEGVAMQALGPASIGSPNAAAVFRFFDTVHGTHFLTASAAERDQLRSTRPDLVFEPGSTLYEHAAQEAGDVPVFRFFDTSLGTHFYTENASERAHILAARAEFTDEGVAFYAPTR